MCYLNTPYLSGFTEHLKIISENLFESMLTIFGGDILYLTFIVDFDKLGQSCLVIKIIFIAYSKCKIVLGSF